jgi:hypothetical protein
MKMLTLVRRSLFSSLNFNKISNLDPEIEDLRASIRRFADEKVAPLAH